MKLLKLQNMIYALMMMSILLIPTLGYPVANALTVSGPTPIPTNLLPIPSSTGTSPVIPSLPDLGTVSTALPPISIYSINKVTSGLVVSDSLTNETMSKDQLIANQNYWHYGGSATVNKTPFDISRDSQGLHIGVQANNDGNWTGYYAVTQNTNAAVFHAVVTTASSVIPNDFYSNGLYVQTSTPNVSYVSCFADTSKWGTVWAIYSATGNPFGATTFNQLWYDPSPNQPLTRDCTIVTNGDNYLKVYLDGVKVYENSTLNLQMPGPFIVFLEPQTSYPGQMLYGTYRDYYSVTSENIRVTNTPLLASTVDLVDPTGKVLATAPVSSGTANLVMGQYHMPLVAYIKIYDSNGIQLASTNSPVNIFGGDVYSVKSILGLL